MDPIEIKAAIERAGASLAELGRKINVSRSTASRVLGGSARNSELEKLIAQAIQMPLHVVFPEWYKDDQAKPTGFAGPHLGQIYDAPLALVIFGLQRALEQRWGVKIFPDTGLIVSGYNEVARKGVFLTGNERTPGNMQLVAQAMVELVAFEEQMGRNTPAQFGQLMQQSESGISIGTNTGQVNKGGENIFNKFK